MNESIIVGLLQNVAILLAFGMLYDYLWAKEADSKRAGAKILTGFILGGFGIILILTPWTLIQGLIFDTRSVMLSVSGLFFGPVPTLIAMVITGGYRIVVGGDGTLMGVAVILTSGLIGLMWRRFRPDWQGKHYLWELLALGLLVHLIMLGCTVFLPSGMTWDTLRIIAFPVMIIYPAGTILLGILLLKRSQNWKIRNALVQSEERWHFALEGAGDGVWDWNPQTNEVFYSSRLKQMLGFTEEEITNSIDEWEQRIHPSDKEKVYQDLNNHLEGKTLEYVNIHRLLCKDGMYKWILDRGKVMQWDQNGKPIRMIGTHTDISERKKVEEELSSAKERAEESDRLKMSFLNNISHEVRTPLNAILGFSNLLNDPLSETEKARFILVINQNAEHLLKIIDDVLEFSRLETEKIFVEQHAFSIRELLDNLFHSVKHLAEEKNLIFICLPGNPDKQDTYLGDRARILQVLTCFITNAIKYTPEGSIEVGSSQDDQGIRFYVRDTGIGIPEEYRSRIFERFYRAPEAQQLATRGTGLGLSIAKYLIELMGGTIGVNPVETGGSEFFFTLKLPEVTLQQTTSMYGERTSCDLSEFSLIIAEDEDTNFEFLQVILKHRFKEIYRAKTGIEVLEISKNHLPDLILMDLKMPLMNGYEAAKEMKKIHPDVPIIALTAYSQPEEKKLAAEAGCTYFISKPVQKEALIAMIEQAMGKKQ